MNEVLISNIPTNPVQRNHDHKYFEDVFVTVPVIDVTNETE